MDYKIKVNPFYDTLIELEDVEIPSKRVGYKKRNGILVAKVPLGVIEFERWIREAFSIQKVNGWPHSGPLMIAIGISMPIKQHKRKDLDNMVKTILDAFTGIAFDDDSFIESICVSKIKSDKKHVFIGFHEIKENEKSWFAPPFCLVKGKKPV